MTEGILLYCYNNTQVDYAKLCLLSGSLAKKNLNKPVSLVTDQSTIDWMHKSELYPKAEKLFDKIIVSDRPAYTNNRNLYNGRSYETVPFINQNRYCAYDHTPYDKTLIIDSDFLILENSLNEYFKVDQSVIIGECIRDIWSNKRLGYLDDYISHTGIKMLWATTCLFTKNTESKMFFDLVKTIQENYSVFSHVFRYSDLQYRNDIAFSIADHILNGFQPNTGYKLPPVLSALDKDLIHNIDDNKISFLVDKNLDGNYFLTTVQNLNVHVMNKQNLVDHYDKLEDKL